MRPSWLSRDVLAGWRESPAPSPPVSSGWPDYGERAREAALFPVWLHLPHAGGRVASSRLGLGAGCGGVAASLGRCWPSLKLSTGTMGRELLWRGTCCGKQIGWEECSRILGRGKRCWWVRWRLLVLAPKNAQPASLMEGNKNRACQSPLPWRKFLPISTAPERVPR